VIDQRFFNQPKHPRGNSMQSDEIYQQLSGIFADVFDDDAIVLKPAMTADDVDGWDSLTHIRLIISVEKAFKIKFSTSEVGKLKNVGEFVDLIASKV
jgi:acyl carrier protein